MRREAVIRIEGDPVPKLRHRQARAKDGRRVTYTPARTRLWEREVALQGRVAVAGLGCPWRGAVAVRMEFTLRMPRSWSGRRRAEAAGRPHVTRPDLANLVKAVEDALNGVVWADDSQISTLEAHKRHGDEAGVVIRVTGEGDTA